MLNYIRTYQVTGEEYKAPFDGSHHHVFSDNQRNYGKNAMVRVASDLIDKWNRQQPGTWSYKMDTEESK